MSVGVCVINRNGIALAADSAGTFTRNKMFYNTMNKVFSLSNKYTYGAITYGQLSLANVSIEQILREFCLYMDSKDCVDNFFEIIRSFQDFIKEKSKYYKFDTAETTYCNSIIKELVDTWGNKLRDAINEKSSEEKIDKVLEELKRAIAAGTHIDNFDISEYIREKYADFYSERVNIVVPEMKDYPMQRDALWEMISQYFNLQMKIDSDRKTGLFFAGYGYNDAFPKFIHTEIYSIVNGKLKYRIIDQFEESDNNAQIIPLAQTDVVLTFCKGISNSFVNYIPRKVDELLSSKIEKLPTIFSEDQKRIIKEVFASCKGEVENVINKSIQRDNVLPILESVQLIPLPEMAFLAESLVNITTLKRTFALDGNQQTVGGPTDVAVLSKGEGFIWIKQKELLKMG